MRCAFAVSTKEWRRALAVVPACVSQKSHEFRRIAFTQRLLSSRTIGSVRYTVSSMGPGRNARPLQAGSWGRQFRSEIIHTGLEFDHDRHGFSLPRPKPFIHRRQNLALAQLALDVIELGLVLPRFKQFWQTRPRPESLVAQNAQNNLSDHA
jgi:hypothetical protein